MVSGRFGRVLLDKGIGIVRLRSVISLVAAPGFLGGGMGLGGGVGLGGGKGLEVDADGFGVAGVDTDGFGVAGVEYGYGFDNAGVFWGSSFSTFI